MILMSDFTLQIKRRIRTWPGPGPSSGRAEELGEEIRAGRGGSSDVVAVRAWKSGGSGDVDGQYIHPLVSRWPWPQLCNNAFAFLRCTL